MYSFFPLISLPLINKFKNFQLPNLTSLLSCHFKFRLWPGPLKMGHFGVVIKNVQPSYECCAFGLKNILTQKEVDCLKKKFHIPDDYLC